MAASSRPHDPWTRFHTSTRARRAAFVIALGALVALGPFTIDLYVPAFPHVARDFATTDGVVQWTLSGTAVGFSLGQLAVGPLSDGVGRRVPLLVATVVHIGASIGVALAPSLPVLILMRVLQGVGASAGGVVAGAMVRDLYEGRRLVRTLAGLGLVSGLAPIVAPLIGSQLLALVDWRGIFWLLAAYGAVMLATAVLLIRETLPARGPRSTERRLRERLGALVRDRVYLGTAIVSAMVLSAILSYASASPFLLESVYGATPQQYGLLFGINSVGLLGGAQLSALVMRRVEPAWQLAVGLGVVLLAGAGLVVAASACGGIVPVGIALFALTTGCGLCNPCTQVLTLLRHRAEAGTAAAIAGFVTTAVAGLVSPLSGAFGPVSGLSLGVVIVACAAIATLALWLVVRPRHVPPLAR